MSGRRSSAMDAAIAFWRANPKVTGYALAKQFKLAHSAVYKAIEQEKAKESEFWNGPPGRGDRS